MQDLAGGGDPIQARHRNIRHDDVRRQPLGGVDERDAVLHQRDDVELLLEQATQEISRVFVIVGEQQRWM